MRYLAHDIETNKVVQQSQVQNSGREVRWEWIPRIRCHDCPGKLYTPGPEQTVESFLVHVKNRGHR
jgi:SWI/SNF-related matrix-associated actin-dependent regulator of chromatin subfamily B protein 1